MKEIYVTPEANIIIVDLSDIITVSLEDFGEGDYVEF